MAAAEENFETKLTGRGYYVTVRRDGEVVVKRRILDDQKLLDTAVMNEIKSALEDAIQGGEVGGYCVDPETGTVEPVAGYAVKQGA